MRKAEQAFGVSSLFLAYATILSPSQPLSKCSSPVSCLDLVRNTIAVSQHHDAIVGTSLPDVVVDSLKRLSTVQNEAIGVYADAAGVILGRGTSPNLTADMISVSKTLLSGKTAVVVVSNGLGWARVTPVAVTVPFANISIISADGKVSVIE